MDSASSRYLLREECERIANYVLGITRGGGSTVIQINSNWEGTIRWARNRVSMASNARRVSVNIERHPYLGARGNASTNQIDKVSLEGVVRAAERAGGLASWRTSDLTDDSNSSSLPVPDTKIWSDVTDSASDKMRAEIVVALVEGAEDKGFLAAGYSEMRSGQVAMLTQDRFGNKVFGYDAFTNAQCSMTARNAKGTGSGWAGVSSYDWGSVSGRSLAEIALDKCIRSVDPVAIEPGRYTVILEPQALYQLVDPMVSGLTSGMQRRDRAEEGQGNHPFFHAQDVALGISRSKLGLKVMDERITIRHDTLDPSLGIVPQSYTRDSFTMPYSPVTYVEKGILMSLAHEKPYAQRALYSDKPDLPRRSYAIEGSDSSMEEMIASTNRGLLVTRFSNVKLLNQKSILMTGSTRDGLWLIENGAISKSVKNMRFLDSPMFVLNQVEQIGPASPVYTYFANEPQPALIPSIKSRDFSFVSLVDAV